MSNGPHLLLNNIPYLISVAPCEPISWCEKKPAHQGQMQGSVNSPSVQRENGFWLI